MKPICVQGCMCLCTLGTTPAVLQVAGGPVTVNGQQAASISDVTFVIPTAFTICRIAPPIIKPCSPVFAGPWICDSSLMLNGKKVLTMGSTAICTAGGGTIIAALPGQFRVMAG